MNRDKNWHSRSNADLERIFRTDGAKGLGEGEAQRRLRHGRNTVWEVKTASAGRYAVRSLFDLTTVILILTVVACAFFDFGDAALAILCTLFIGRVARVGIYIWSERVFEKNASLALPRAKVVRGGNVKIIAADRIVTGDVIILDTGDTVPCDIRLTAADNILISEGNITGNDGIVSKNSDIIISEGEVPVTMRKNMLYAGSTVISGFAIGIAVATGDDTLICTREGRTVLAGEKDVSTVEKLSDWGRICSICLIAMALVITAVGLFVGGGDLFEVFLPSIAMAAAGLSEYISAIGSFAWAYKLKCDTDAKSVLLKASVAEKAANTELLILRNVNVVKSKKNTLHSYYEGEKLTMMGTKEADIPAKLLRLACYCTGATPEGSVVSGALATRQKTEGVLPYALVRTLCEESREAIAKEERYTIVQHLPAVDRESLGIDCVLLARGNDFYFSALGRVEDILSMCAYQRKGEDKAPLSDSDREKILAYAVELRRHGVTVAAVGFRDSHYNNLRRVSVLQSNMCFEGFIAVADRPEEGVVQYLTDFRTSGGKIVIFSEDGEVDKFYCEAEGIYKTGDIFLSAKESREVKNISFEKDDLIIIETPRGADGLRERIRLSKLLCESGLVSTYVGYGIEDMWCMKTADSAFAVNTPQGLLPQGIRTACHGIAESQSGGLMAVCNIIRKCRCAMISIRNALKYPIVSHVARLILMLVCAAAGLVMPTAPILVLWGVIIDFAVAFATVSIKNNKAVPDFDINHISQAPDSKRSVILPTMYGSLLAVLCVITPFITGELMKYAGMIPEITGATLMTCMAVSCLIAMPVVGAEYAGGYGLFSRRSRLSLFYIIPFALTLGAVAALFLIPSFGAAMGVVFPGWIMTAFCLVPTLILVGVMSVVRAIKNKGI